MFGRLVQPRRLRLKQFAKESAMGLKLTRRAGESFEIIPLAGAHVKVTVFKSLRGRLELEVEAPKDWKIVRSEILDHSPDRSDNTREKPRPWPIDGKGKP